MRADHGAAAGDARSTLVAREGDHSLRWWADGAVDKDDPNPSPNPNPDPDPSPNSSPNPSPSPSPSPSPGPGPGPGSSPNPDPNQDERGEIAKTVVTKDGAYYLQWRELEADRAKADAKAVGPGPGAEEGWSDGVKLVGAGKQVGKGKLLYTCL